MNWDLKWIDACYSCFPHLKGIVVSNKYPVFYIWSKSEQLILGKEQLLYYGKTKYSYGWESLWKIKEEYLDEWNEQKKFLDPEDELIFEDMYEDISNYLLIQERFSPKSCK